MVAVSADVTMRHAGVDLTLHAVAYFAVQVIADEANKAAAASHEEAMQVGCRGSNCMQAAPHS